MKNRILNIIEPTLFDQTGHSYSYVQSLLQANKEFGYTVKVWCDQRGRDLFAEQACSVQPYFKRALRQAQKLWLYLKLIRKPGIIFIGTSDLWDLKIMACLVSIFHPQAKVCLHFHQFKQTPEKLNALREIAQQQHRLHIFTPTEKLSQIFTNNGFEQCTVVPCPTFTPPRTIDQTTGEFKKVLYAGAARSDKGFPTVVQLLAFLRANDINTPFEMQISAPNSQRYDQATTKALQILPTIDAHNLTLHRHTLDQTQYLNLFNNSICLLIYDQENYKDKFSGIALDAFYAGCPIITVKNTWMGETAEKYNAGIALDNLDMPNINAAIETIIQNYAVYNANAKQAAVELQQLHDPRHTLALLSA